MKTTAVSFPMDLGGSPGTSQGARLLADALREILDDTQDEIRACRAKSFAGQVRLRELAFETPAQVAAWRQRGGKSVRRVWDQGEFLLWLGGNHLGALPVYEELGRQPGGLVVQFDAHLDLYHLHDTTRELSHGNFLRHLPEPRPALVNLGHRDLFLLTSEISDHFRWARGTLELEADPPGVMNLLRQTCATAERIVIDIDIDVFDPAFAPAVSHPMPIGLAPGLLLRFLDAIWSEAVVGVCISEFDPGRDRDDRTLALLVWLLEYLLLKRHEPPTTVEM
jgi:agmatinase